MKLGRVYEYKIQRVFLPRKCLICGKYSTGKCVRRLKGSHWQYFCSPKCAKEHCKASNDTHDLDSENVELWNYLDKN